MDFQQLVEESPLAIWVIGLEGRITYVNAALRRLRGDASGRELESVFAPASAARVAQLLAKVQRHHPIGEAEVLDHLRADGTLARGDVALSVVRDRAGAPVGLQGLVRLRPSETFDESLVDARLVALEAAAAGVIITNLRGVIEYANPAICEMTGYTRDELLGRTPAIFKSGAHPAEFYRNVWDTILAGHIWRGEMINLRKDRSPYTEEQAIAPVLGPDGKVRRFVSVKQDVTARRTLEKQLEAMAFSDQLTGLPNRPLFFDRVERAMEAGKRSGRTFALLYIDLDGFKQVNDRFGHETGDELLVAVARRLQLAVRASDTVARMGGDEFTVLLLDVAAEAQVGAVAEKLVQVLSAEYKLTRCQCVIGASIGISSYPADGADAETLLARADVAMYAAKRRGKGRFARFGETPALVLSLRDADFRLPERGEVVIGRGAACDIRVADPMASSRHVRVSVRSDGVWIEDLDSRNGTLFNGQRLTEPRRVELDSHFIVGGSRFVMRLATGLAVPTSETATQSLSAVIRTLVPPSAK